MEKRRPHYDLQTIKADFATRRAPRMTRTAHDAALALGLTLADVLAVVQTLSAAHFYKSMTSLSDSRIWQDVYHVPWAPHLLYLKVTIDDAGYFLLSFKEK